MGSEGVSAMNTMIDLANRMDELRIATVTRGDWSVSYTIGSGIKGAILNVSTHYVNGKSTPCLVCDKKSFSSRIEAHAQAIDHGHLALYIEKFLSEREMWRHRRITRQVENARRMGKNLWSQVGVKS